VTEEAFEDDDYPVDPAVRRVKTVLFTVVFSAISIVIILMLVFAQPEGQRRISHWPNGYKKSETWYDAREGGAVLQEGPHRAWYESGQLAEEGSYHFGERNGEWSFWSEDRVLDEERSGTYADGVRTGPTEL